MDNNRVNNKAYLVQHLAGMISVIEQLGWTRGEWGGTDWGKREPKPVCLIGAHYETLYQEWRQWSGERSTEPEVVSTRDVLDTLKFDSATEATRWNDTRDGPHEVIERIHEGIKRIHQSV